MAAALTDEPVTAVAALHGAIAGLRCSSAASRALFDGLAEQLASLQPQLADSIAAMREAAAFGQTLKQSQSKALQVCAGRVDLITVWQDAHQTAYLPAALQEFSMAITNITAALQGTRVPSSNGGSTTGSSSTSCSGRAPSGSGRRPVLPDGVSALNPDAFYHAKMSLVAALGQLAAAFKGAALGEALSVAKDEVEDLGLFE